ncbi:LOW QUALITY PROTEIN: uncharacterized protein LOC111079846 [Drosophila obscura]|uniref:LOW QUALITY PROTEIN: uncharacterized protein LOC111079846 n=1 Tax=Drosophila obscura TaxID=7282 RepID=UPI001BB0FD1A|nr:LOW QUALITY PROTEIN: uncharacterized protein LOC111079846 [Drosophila obscura]
MANKKMFNRTTSISPGQLHYYHTDFYYSMADLNKTRKMHGVKRVLIFCLLIVILPATLIIMPLHLRKTVFADVVYPMAESDIIEIRAGISSIFCSKHTLKMTSNFNAFQLRNKPEISTNRKHIRLKKSMTLPDDTLEYWGFFLLKGANVRVKFCSRFDGSRILIVKGQRQLNLCGLTDHNQKKLGANYAKGHEQVKVFFEDKWEMEGPSPPATEGGVQEHENHGGEDLSEDPSPQQSLDLPPGLTLAGSTATSTSTKPIRKKLKKGTPHLPQMPVTHHHHGHSSSAMPHQAEHSSSATPLHSAEADHSLGGKVVAPTQGAAQQKRQRKRELYERLYNRTKRESVYDRKYSHGGNAVNFTETDESNSVSSFENGLFLCFNGAILLSNYFRPNESCTSPHFMESAVNNNRSFGYAVQDVVDDGYYYYIFYSDNDEVRNDIHVIFDIYKPTFQYSNLSESQSCLNTTECNFNISFLSDEIVVVEVPTRDGIEHEEDDISYLVSTCHPRSEIYAIFPITVMVLILCCSFL